MNRLVLVIFSALIAWPIFASDTRDSLLEKITRAQQYLSTTENRIATQRQKIAKQLN